ncbi:MAG: rhodanese-like domain-containing protein [Nocardioides sp.]|nr:rhodanese-like domain-containing protein [Nocardioides sp.]
MQKVPSWRRLAATVTLVVLAASGCAGSDSGDSADEAPAQAAPTAVVEPTTVRDAIAEGAELIDVRTPEEFASGHLRGAVNVDSADPDFAELIADLDETASYVVYCASGNRAGAAILTMRDLGFDDVVNGGGFDDLAALGLPTA